MGFFRFRRSIKILPGLRWNIGKKSTSFTFGGKGFHHTIGTRGRKTTLGIPGTGLSYTTTSGSSAREQRRRAKDAASEWASKQKKSVKIEYPERQSDEPDATQRQKNYVRSLVQSIDEDALARLGRWQATTLIDQIKLEKEMFTQEKVEEYVKSKQSGGCLGLIAKACIGLILFSFLMSLFSGVTNTQKISSPTPISAKPVHTPVPKPPLISPNSKANIPSAPSAKSAPIVSKKQMDRPRVAKEPEPIINLPIKLYPDLANPRSKLSIEFYERYDLKKHTEPDYFKTSEWPTALAKESNDYIRGLSH